MPSDTTRDGLSRHRSRVAWRSRPRRAACRAVHRERVGGRGPALAVDAGTTPDLISIKLGHIAAWEPLGGGEGRRTPHYPNSYDDITRMIAFFAEDGIRPELGIMDLGFVSNAVALRDDGALLDDAWFLLELDSPAYGSGMQTAPATVANDEAVAVAMHENFPAARATVGCG